MVPQFGPASENFDRALPSRTGLRELGFVPLTQLATDLRTLLPSKISNSTIEALASDVQELAYTIGRLESSASRDSSTSKVLWFYTHNQLITRYMLTIE